MILGRFDSFLLKLINRPFNPYLNLFCILILFSIYFYLFSLFFLLYRRKQKEELFHLLVTSAVGLFTATLLKYATNIPRPNFNPILKRSDPSFPSRHSLMAGLGLHFSFKAFYKALKAISTIYILLVLFSSVYVGVHYPSDVIVGFLIGLLIPRLISRKTSNRLLERILRLMP